jgi:hypothetical protein
MQVLEARERDIQQVGRREQVTGTMFQKNVDGWQDAEMTTFPFLPSSPATSADFPAAS